MDEIYRIFSIPIWIGEVKDKQNINESLLNNQIIKENKTRVYQHFRGDFNSSFGLDAHLDEKWVDDILDEILSGFKKFIFDLTAENKPLPKNIELNDIWFNCYKEGQYQESHDHLGYDFKSPFSFIYYLKLPLNGSRKTVFVNDGYKKNKFFYSDNLNILETEHSPNLKEGQYIIFPSFLTHYVIHHEDINEQRITLAGNIQLKYE